MRAWLVEGKGEGVWPEGEGWMFGWWRGAGWRGGLTGGGEGLEAWLAGCGVHHNEGIRSL